MMRWKFSRILALLVVIVNVVLVYFSWKYLLQSSTRGDVGVSNAQQQSSVSKTLEIAEGKPFPDSAKPSKPRDRIQSANKHIKKMVTIVFRDFYHFDTDLRASIDSVLSLIPNIQIVVVYDGEPYPPLEYVTNYTTSKNNVHFVNTEFDVHRTGKSMSPMHLVKTRYTLLLPDSVRLGGRSIIQKMLREIERNDVGTFVGAPKREKEVESSNGRGEEIPAEMRLRRMVVVPFSSNIRGYTSCCNLMLDFANWTLEYSVRNGTDNCDLYLQKHAILLETAMLKEMPIPLATPYPEMIFIQAKIMNLRKLHLNVNLQDGKRLFTAFHNKQRKKEFRRQQFRLMYKMLQIKKVIRKVPLKPNGKPDKPRKHLTGADPAIKLMPLTTLNASRQIVTTIEYYGCDKNTKSCVGTVFNQKPFFIYMGKHTPPCCLDKLKVVVQHVLDELENVGIRYWLDNHALKTAIETGGLNADAFEIDISFNAFDLERSETLKKCQTRPVVDTSGFYWMKATDGHYFRVMYSKMNQIGVNLLPFELNGDRMVPNGFYGWKAQEFSSEFVHPMSSVVFLGKNVMCPNNVKEFLDMKPIQ